MVDDYSTRLQTAMQARGVSAQQLATQIGVSYQAVNKVLKGLSTAFSASNNAYAARFLGVSSDWLATGEGQMIDQARNYALSGDADSLPTEWQSASEEAREVARFALSDIDAPLPAWADKDMRQYVNHMILVAQRWLRGKQPQREEQPQWEEPRKRFAA